MAVSPLVLEPEQPNLYRINGLFLENPQDILNLSYDIMARSCDHLKEKFAIFPPSLIQNRSRLLPEMHRFWPVAAHPPPLAAVCLLQLQHPLLLQPASTPNSDNIMDAIRTRKKVDFFMDIIFQSCNYVKSLCYIHTPFLIFTGLHQQSQLTRDS